MKKILYPLLACALLFSCQKTDNLIVKEETDQIPAMLIGFEKHIGQPFTTEGYTRILSKHLQEGGLDVVPVNGHKAALGRVLFYDKSLSADRTVSCASCHRQAVAFADDLPLSKGIGDKHALRNSMSLANVASVSAHYNPLQKVVPPFLWDQRAATIGDLSRMAFTNPNEMGMTMPDVVNQVKNAEYYPMLFQNAYGETEVTEARILECLTEFVGAIGADHTRLDVAAVRSGQPIDKPNELQSQVKTDTICGVPTTLTVTVLRGLDGLTESENRGREVFFTACRKCHSPIRSTQEVFAACNGLEMGYTDLGLAAVSNRPEDVGVFKSPSLRNIALTAPYMHDGRFKTLREVVEFYSSGIKPHPNLHPALRNADGTTGMRMSYAQKVDLLAFLNTLTDYSITKDDKFSNPFK